MASVKVHYGGWIALPAALREQLSLETGDTLEVERVEGGLLLRVAGGAAATGSRPAADAGPAAPAVEEAAPPARPRGRKPRNPAPPASGSMVLPPVLQGGRGRRRPKNQPAS